MVKSITLASAVAASLLASAPTSWANKANDTLVYASDLEVENIAPYYTNLREGLILKRLVWDALIYRDPSTGAYKPMLAIAWHWVDPVTLDLTIREGVTFHDGSPLTVDDVVFTINYVLSPESKIVTQQDVDWLSSAERLDDHTARLRLKAPFPAAMEFLAGPIQILPQAYIKAVGIDGFAKKPVGSGPYRVTEVSSSGVRMVRNPNYWKDSPIGQPKIGAIEFRAIPLAETRLAELMTGGVDWIWRVAADQALQLAAVPNITVVNSETMRTGSVLFDTQGHSGPNSPFKDVRVRRALSYAVDRKAMVDNLMRGKSDVMSAFCFPAQFGCTQDVPKYSYDPAKAKALLAEAGYPNGFDTEIWAYSDRDYVEALIGYYRAVGVRAKLVFMQYPPLREAVHQGRVPMLFLSWGSSSIYDTSASASPFFTGGNDDMTKDPAVIDALHAGDTTPDPKSRLEDYQKGLARIADQAYALPLFSYSMNYAFSSDLAFTAYPDELPRFYESSWK